MVDLAQGIPLEEDVRDLELTEAPSPKERIDTLLSLLSILLYYVLKILKPSNFISRCCRCDGL